MMLYQLEIIWISICQLQRHSLCLTRCIWSTHIKHLRHHMPNNQLHNNTKPNNIVNSPKPNNQPHNITIPDTPNNHSNMITDPHTPNPCPITNPATIRNPTTLLTHPNLTTNPTTSSYQMHPITIRTQLQTHIHLTPTQ